MEVNIVLKDVKWRVTKSTIEWFIHLRTQRNELTESFINRSQAEHHHTGPSPLLGIIGINIITCFILDFMHLCCIGIMKKLLEYWLAGNLNFRSGQISRQELAKRMKSSFRDSLAHTPFLHSHHG